MSIVRDDVATPWGQCIDCGCGTRSHELEPAEYEVYTAEAVRHASDIYASVEYEEVEEVDRYEMITEAVVMCHKCWVARQDKFRIFVQKKWSEWSSDPVTHVVPIKRAVNTQVYYGYEDEKTIEALKKLAKLLKEAALDG